MVLPALTRTADRSLLWVAIGAGIMATGRRRVHRAARRGLASVAVTSVTVLRLAPTGTPPGTGRDVALRRRPSADPARRASRAGLDEIGPGSAELGFGTARRVLTVYRPAVRGFL